MNSSKVDSIACWHYAFGCSVQFVLPASRPSLCSCFAVVLRHKCYVLLATRNLCLLSDCYSLIIASIGHSIRIRLSESINQVSIGIIFLPFCCTCLTLIACNRAATEQNFDWFILSLRIIRKGTSAFVGGSCPTAGQRTLTARGPKPSDGVQ